MQSFSMKSGLPLALIIICFATVGLAADHTLLTPMLVDLEGWQAEPASGMTMDMGSSKMTNAAREYRQAGKTLNAMVLVGNQAMTQGSMQAMKAENAEGKMSVATIDGFKVMSQYNKMEKTGVVVVYLAQDAQQGAMFTLVYEGLSEDNGLKAAKKFDWQKMKGVVSKFN